MNKIRIIEDYCNDSEEYYLGDQYLGSVNHDEHGWAGIEAARYIVERFAQELKIPIEYEEKEDE